MRNCYLKSTLDLDPNPSAIKFNYQPKMLVYPTNLEVRYTSNVPIMFESGTRGWTDLPSYLYGCPYPPAADGTCTVGCLPGSCYPTHGCLHLSNSNPAIVPAFCVCCWQAQALQVQRTHRPTVACAGSCGVQLWRWRVLRRLHGPAKQLSSHV